MTAGRRLWDAIDALMAAAVRERSALAAALGLRPVDVDALRLIAGESGISPTVVGEALRMSTGGAAAVIDRLVAAGLVERTARPDGRRRVGLETTPGGRVAVDAHRDPLLLELAELADAVDQDAVERCLQEAAAALDRQTERELAAAPSPDAIPDAPPRVLWG